MKLDGACDEVPTGFAAIMSCMSSILAKPAGDYRLPR
jgi:hypothetical protein